MNISIIIFCHNERDNIDKVIQSAFAVASAMNGSFEVIVVDDGSTDGTTDIIKKHVQIKAIVHSTNQGIGMALRTGYATASKEFVCAIPGDGQFDVTELLAVKAFEKNSFYSFYRPQTNYSPYRRLLNLSNRFFNRFFLGIKLNDVNWIKVYRKDQLAFVNIELKSSIVESEICAKLIKAGCQPIEAPSVYHERKSGLSKGGNWKTLSKALGEMFLLFWVVKRFNKQL